MTLVVLGWDGLDYDRVYDYGLPEQFGPVNRRMNTLVNPKLDKPHTFEIWPTIITGLPPDRHGIHAEAYTEGGRFQNPLLNLAARISDYTIPKRLRWAVGRRLRDSGASFAFESLDYYAERDIWTVFDGRYAMPLAVPNARSRFDDALGIEADRGAQLSDYLDVKTGDDGETIHRPSVSLTTLSTRLGADAGHKIGAVVAALPYRFDLIFVWLSFLDTMGHVSPTVENSEQWLRQGYHIAAEWTTHVHQQLQDNDILLCVSDHGLKDGRHTEAAFFGAWSDNLSRFPGHVCEVAKAIDVLAPKAGRADTKNAASDRLEDYQVVKDRLAEMGYLSD